MTACCYTVIRKFKERRPDIEACATCPYYPQCILLTMCEIDVRLYA